MSGVARTVRPSMSDFEAVQTLAPLSAGLTMRCGPFDMPPAAFPSSTALEQPDSEEGDDIRDFIREEAWPGMGSVTAGGWILFGRATTPW